MEPDPKRDPEKMQFYTEFLDCLANVPERLVVCVDW